MFDKMSCLEADGFDKMLNLGEMADWFENLDTFETEPCTTYTSSDPTYQVILSTEARREQDHRRANKDLVNLLPEVTQMKAELATHSCPKVRVWVPMH